MSFSVLCSVYFKERPQYLMAALWSIWDDQSLKPGQIVLVKDGPLTASLDSCIEEWKEKLGCILTIVALPENVGLGAALNVGLEYCRYDLVARMDTDDIAFPWRFERQFHFMERELNISVSSGLIEEWDEDMNQMIGSRKLPLLPHEIRDFAKKRCPISHPAAMYRKRAILEVGGYPRMYPEDYSLWLNLLSKGHDFANLPDALIKMRTGAAFIERRGLRFLKGEFEIFKFQYSIGYTTRFEFYMNCLGRVLLRLSPGFIKRFLYKHAR